mmetsp:Transcript_58370/g.110057  ORF Transcript_58370/g.110057 Transcript_58370/m.110057 type:complete len:262 (+) Transcript_58370:30-815(+)
MEVLADPSQNIREMLEELEYEPEHIFIPGLTEPVFVRTIQCLPLELLALLEHENAEISGRRVWPGSLLLSLVLASPQSPVNLLGGAVLELGAGSGLASIVAKRLGASRIFITDGDATSTELAVDNLADNNIDCASKDSGIVVARLLWGDCESFKTDMMPEGGFSVILAADVMYKKHLPPLLFGTMKGLLSPNGVALLVHLVRAGVTQELVRSAASSAGLDVTVVPLPMALLPHDHCSVEEAAGANIYLIRHSIVCETHRNI